MEVNDDSQRPGDSEQDEDKENDNQNRRKRVVHSYSMCLSCLMDRHDLCYASKGRWKGKMRVRYYLSTCECLSPLHLKA